MSSVQNTKYVSSCFVDEMLPFGAKWQVLDVNFQIVLIKIFSLFQCVREQASVLNFSNKKMHQINR